MSHIFLVGFMGAGKSTVGRALAERLGLPFLDLDDVITAAAGKDVPTIFAEEGEEGFRQRETDALESMSSAPASVVACGGGVVLRASNRETMHRLGTVVGLAVSADEATRRIEEEGGRPLLADGGVKRAEELLGEREAAYAESADLIVNTTGIEPDAVVEAVLSELGKGRA